MLAVPAATPVTVPDVPLMLATVPLSDAHVPPVTASLSVVVRPAQTATIPAMDAGNGFTVITVDVLQPVAVSW